MEYVLFRSAIRLAALQSFYILLSMASSGAKSVIKKVKPILSLDKEESRRRVIALYKAWYRYIPQIDRQYYLPVSVPDMRNKLKEEFMKNKHIEDIRVIDLLTAKGEMELKEIIHQFKQGCHIMYYFKDSVTPKPKDFISKFLEGHD